MNSTLNEAEKLFSHNAALFKTRFPQLYEIHREDFLNAQSLSAINVVQQLEAQSGIELFTAKSGAVTARVQTGGAEKTLIHSAYDPVKEAEKLLDAKISHNAARDLSGQISHNAHQNNSRAFIFYGFGLGYLPIAAAKRFPSDALVLVEPDISCFLLALFCLDWSAVFAVPQCILLIGADIHSAAEIIERYDSEKSIIFNTGNELWGFGGTKHIDAAPGEGGMATTARLEPRGKAFPLLPSSYFSNLRRLVNLHRQQKNVNTRTLEAFGMLWLKNSARNLRHLALCESIESFRGIASGMPACVIAAGPSLDTVTPHLKDIQTRCITIAVDTALRACLRAGVEPDFIVLTDPQYWASQHIAGLQSPSSVLVTELAVYPSVMRFPCRAITLFDSIYPPGQYFSRKGNAKGALAAGGSVASSAWDLARLLGASKIFFAALDLGFPRTKTHARGSVFEERVHAQSRRLCPAQTHSVAALFSAQTVRAKDYAGAELLSDERMTLYAWWFENEFSKDAEISPNAPRPVSITQQSRALKGMRYAPLHELLALSDISAHKKDALGATLDGENTGAKKNPAKTEASLSALNSALQELRAEITKMREHAQTGNALCKESLAQKESPRQELFDRLSALDNAIKSNGGQNVVSLVLPSQEKLQEEYAARKNYSEQNAAPQKERLIRFMIFCAHVERAAALCLAEFPETT